MSNGSIVYNYDEMIELAGRISKCHDAFEEIQSEMEGIVASLIDAIKGDVQTSYEAGHASVKSQYTEVQDDTKDLADKLTTAASTMQEGDSTAGKTVRNSFS